MNSQPAAMEVHPCPTPRRTKRDREGTVWACACGALYALRNDWNYAGDVWVWKRIGA